MPGSKITLTDAMLTLFTMYATSHSSKDGLQRILDLLQVLVPQNLLPKTVDSFLEPFACDEGLIYKDFCESCCYLDELTMKNALYVVVGSTKEENQSKKRRK